MEYILQLDISYILYFKCIINVNNIIACVFLQNMLFLSELLECALFYFLNTLLNIKVTSVSTQGFGNSACDFGHANKALSTGPLQFNFLVWDLQDIWMWNTPLSARVIEDENVWVACMAYSAAHTQKKHF